MAVAMDRSDMDNVGRVCRVVFECMYLSNSLGKIVDKTGIKLCGLRKRLKMV
jgi:hypothetical protein